MITGQEGVDVPLSYTPHPMYCVNLESFLLIGMRSHNFQRGYFSGIWREGKVVSCVEEKMRGPKYYAKVFPKIGFQLRIPMSRYALY